MKLSLSLRHYYYFDLYIKGKCIKENMPFWQFCTVVENIIATIKMRNNFCYSLKMVIFPILRQQYWNIGYFSIAPHLVIALPTLRQQKLSLLISLLQFLYEFCRLVHGFFSYCFPYSYRSFTLLKALAKSNSNFFAIAFKSDIQRESHQKRSKELIPKKNAKRIKSDNFTRSNREKSNIAIAILEK